ncbi:molybdenum cofactor guanylyltransferase MobA [Devosia sp.]|uniref:molybdenum cofactor guanylyltransferase MobA n=1 Tax=Devosia sp. TaxID=1871048 RepID=UPI002AFE929D|nr:molybdenum cofactor guanylyltransferase MobA [Devosia sp.]
MDDPLPSRFAPAGRKPNGILVVVLAGGRATRMGGGDKSLLQLGGMSLLEHVLARLEPQCQALAISANGDPARFSRFGYPVLADSVPGFAGPLAGILSGLDWAAENQAKAIVTVAADTPFLPHDLVMRLREAAATKRAAIALAASPDAAGLLRRHPTCGLWPVALREPLRADLVAEFRKAMLWADRHAAATAVFCKSRVDPFFNVNTPQDLVQAQALAQLGE